MSMSAVSLDELAKVPFVDLKDLRGRTISSLSFWDGEWHLWVQLADGKLMKIQGWPAEGGYFGKDAQQPMDAYLEFLNFIAQHCSIPSVMPMFISLQQDFFNMCASIRKFDLLHEQSGNLKTAAGRLVATELEYLFSLCRSVFDLLQEIVAVQWQAVKLVDPNIKKKQLPRSFADVALSAGTLRSEDELINRFHLPQPLAAFYARHGLFFEILRTFRDRFVHGGSTPEQVFVTERGFAVVRTSQPFCRFTLWTEEHMLPNELCSLRPVIGHLVVETLRACEDDATTIQTIIQWPPPIAPGMSFFLRGFFNGSMAQCTEAIDKCLWWEPPAPVQQQP
jgi:hypothetical protein